jgi:hypothetical protein
MRQGKECKEVVVLALHNLSFVAETGASPAPVSPKSINVFYLLDNNVTKKF